MTATGVLRASLSKQIHVWLAGWLLDRARKALLPAVQGERHLLFAVCDHFEPLHGGVTREVGLARVKAWRDRLPAFERFRDENGRPPRYSFFFPGDQYDPAFLEGLAPLVEAGLGEVEVHLHHDGDTRASLAHTLGSTVEAFASHGLVPRRDQRWAWSFIHGNWSLANGRKDGRYCGVDDELRCLHELGCYADFTFPSAPDPCQPALVNSIYYPRDDTRRRAYDEGERARVGTPRRDSVLLIQGPLAIAHRPPRAFLRTPASLGSSLRIEASALSPSDPPSPARLATWMDQWVHVEGRPEWTFVKVHTHGAPERNAEVMLGEPMAALHSALAALAVGGRWRVHYVSAREMYNVARAAMDGRGGSPADYFDHVVPPPSRSRVPGDAESRITRDDDSPRAARSGRQP
jgi:hypothetical protein